MSKPTSEIYVQTPTGPGERVLHAGRLLAVGSDRYHADLSVDTVAVDPDSSLLLCYEQDSQFVKEPVRVVGFERVGQRVLVELEVVGDPSSAESRTSFRLRTDHADLFARLGEEEHCLVINISRAGFALYAEREHRIGQTIEAAICHDGSWIAGNVTIRNAQQLDNQWIRYGVSCADEGSDALAAALPRIKHELECQARAANPR